MIENKEEISLNEFKAWLVGLIRGKNGKLPDLEDWKSIKSMLDKVVPEKEIVTVKEKSEPFDRYRYYPPYYTGDPLPSSSDKYIWWSDNTSDITVGGTYTSPPKYDVNVDGDVVDTEALLKLVEDWNNNG